MKRILKCLSVKDYIYIVLIIGFIALQVFCDLEIPDYFGEIVKTIQYGGEISKIWTIGLKMLLVTLGSIGSVILIGYFASYVSSRISQKLRKQVFIAVNEFSIEEINKFSVASLITRTTSDVEQLHRFVYMLLKMALSRPILAVGALIKIITQNIQITFVTLIAVVIMFSIMALLYFRIIKKFEIQQKQLDKLNSVSRENLTGIRVVWAFNNQQFEEKKFEKANKDLTDTSLYINKITALIGPIMQLLGGGLSIAILWVGAILMNNNTIEYSQLVTFTQYATTIVFNLIMMSMFFVHIPKAIVSGKRINEVLKTKSSIISGNFDGNTEITGKVEFKNIEFSYKDALNPVLKNINFEINKGETLAIIGSIGSGKSSLINLIPRFYDCTKGEILVDEVNVKDYKYENLQNKIGFVPQKVSLFGGTIKENLLIAKNDATIEEMWKALEIAQAKDFIQELDGGLDYDISQGGKNISGGQKQRISIARAIIKNPEILIFDDSFSALDFKTDSLLQKALKENLNNTTKIVVSQRIGTIKNAGKIIVIEAGEIVGIGKHSELMKNCKTYKEIALSQLSTKEVM